jgi:hypothetical protein
MEEVFLLQNFLNISGELKEGQAEESNFSIHRSGCEKD